MKGNGTCTECGYAVDVRRVTVFVDGKLTVEFRLCQRHLDQWLSGKLLAGIR